MHFLISGASRAMHRDKMTALQVVNGPINFILPFMACLKGLQLAKAAADARRVQVRREPSISVVSLQGLACVAHVPLRCGLKL